MNIVVRAGIILGVAVFVWSLLFGLTGLYVHPSLNWIFVPGAILIELLVLIWALRQTAAAGKRLGGQVVTGLLIALVGSVIIVLGSLLITMVIIPDYIDNAMALQADKMRDAGTPEAQIEQMMQFADSPLIYVINAVSGVFGTVITGVVLSLIIGFFVRHKD